MYKYEFAHIIVSEGKKDEEIQEVIGNVRQIIGELGGRIVKEDVWGQKELAYEIEKQNHGFYMFTIMMMEPEKVPELEKRMKLVEGTMRYMIINLDREPGYEDDLNITSEKIEKDKAIAANDSSDEPKAVKKEKKNEKAKEEKKAVVANDSSDEPKEEEFVKEEKKKATKEEKVEEKEEEEPKDVATDDTSDKPKKEDKSDEDINKLIDEKLNEIL